MIRQSEIDLCCSMPQEDTNESTHKNNVYGYMIQGLIKNVRMLPRFESLPNMMVSDVFEVISITIE